jgi:hypothetical protein
MNEGIDIIVAERRRQIEKFDWSPAHDDQYVNGELLLYAQYWMAMPELVEARKHAKVALQSMQQTGWEDEWFKYDERTPEQRLARAGALIAAEIDRLKRLEEKQ